MADRPFPLPLPLRLPDPPPVHGAVRLRPYVGEDLALALALATDPYVTDVSTLEPRATPEQGLAWIRRQQSRCEDGTGYALCVVRADTGEPVGNAGLWLAGLADGRATVGYAVAPDHRGHGYAADALSALLDLAWRIPLLHRVEAWIEPWNTASIRTAERAGLTFEGLLLRSHREIGGRRVDMRLHAAIREEAGTSDGVG